MKAFLTPLQGLAEFEQIKEKSKTNKGIPAGFGVYGIAEISSDVRTFRDCALSSDLGGG